MLLITDATFLGVSSGEGQRGAYYNISFMSDNEPFRLNATKEAYEKAKDLDFGFECKLHVSARLFDRNWILRVIDLT